VWLFTGWLAGLAVTVAGEVLTRSGHAGPWLTSFLSLAPNVAGAGVVLLFGLAATRARAGVVLLLRRPPRGVFPWIALSSICLALLGAALNTWIDRVFPMPPEVEEIFQRVLEYHTLPQFLWVFAFLVVVAPVTEELMFRGLFLHRLAEGYGPWPAIFGSALCFGIFHILPWQAIGAVVVGIYLGWLAFRTGSIFTAMAAHALFNLVPVAATGLAGEIPILRGLGAGPTSDSFHFTPRVVIGALVALGAGVLGTLRATRRSSSPVAPDPETGIRAELLPPEL